MVQKEEAMISSEKFSTRSSKELVVMCDTVYASALDVRVVLQSTSSDAKKALIRMSAHEAFDLGMNLIREARRLIKS